MPAGVAGGTGATGAVETDERCAREEDAPTAAALESSLLDPLLDLKLAVLERVELVTRPAVAVKAELLLESVADADTDTLEG